MSGNEDFVNIMTDAVGTCNKAVMVSKYESLAAYEQSFQKYMQESGEEKIIKEKMAGYQELYHTGSREIYHVW